MNALINRNKVVSDDIMEFSVDNSANSPFKRGKKVSSTEGIQVTDSIVLQELEPEATYLNHGTEEGVGMEYHKMEYQNPEAVQKEDQASTQF